MRAGVSSFAFGWGVQLGCPTVDEQYLLRFARDCGFGVVQLGDNLPVHAMARDRRRALRAAAHELGMELELGARGLTRDHLERYLELAAELEAPLLRFVVDAPGHEPDPNWIVTTLREAAPRIAAQGVTVAIENHDRLGARELRNIIDAVAQPRIGVCLDTANSLGAGEGLEFVTHWLAPVAVNLHVKDVTIRRAPSQMGLVIEGCPLGEGRLPIRGVLQQARAIGRCRSVILEAWSSRAATDSETTRQELDAAEQSARVLQRWLKETADSVGAALP